MKRSAPYPIRSAGVTAIGWLGASGPTFFGFHAGCGRGRDNGDLAGVGLIRGITCQVSFVLMSVKHNVNEACCQIFKNRTWIHRRRQPEHVRSRLRGGFDCRKRKQVVMHQQQHQIWRPIWVAPIFESAEMGQFR